MLMFVLKTIWWRYRDFGEAELFVSGMRLAVREIVKKWVLV